MVIMREWTSWATTRTTAESYHVGKGTTCKISDDDGATWKEVVLRNDKTYLATAELDAPPGFRRFKVKTYIFQFEDKHVLTADIWSLL